MLLKKTNAGAFTKAFGDLAWGQAGNYEASTVPTKEQLTKEVKKEYFEEKLKNKPKKLKKAKNIFPRLDS